VNENLVVVHVMEFSGPEEKTQGHGCSHQHMIVLKERKKEHQDAFVCCFKNGLPRIPTARVTFCSK
jgi:hypothetical protein